MKKTIKLTNGIQHDYALLADFESEADERIKKWGITDKFSCGDAFINEYIGNSPNGGFGTDYGYEIFMIFGSTGVSKSTFASQCVVEAALRGHQIAYMALEDDSADVCARIKKQTASRPWNAVELAKATKKVLWNVHMAPYSQGYTLDAMAVEIDSLFGHGYEIVVVDPLQFIFEASAVERGETEFNRQRLFMRQINALMKQNKGKVLMLVSHTNKGSHDADLDNVMGSGANVQVPTKIVQVGRNKDGTRFIKLCKTRFTPFRCGKHQVTLDTNTMRLTTVSGTDPDWSTQLRKSWERNA